MKPELESFRDAFSPPAGMCRVDCECGKVYYDSHNSVDWEPGEYEDLEKRGIAVDQSLGCVEFEGRQYAYDCDCWHERAEKIILFVNAHGHRIAKFFEAEHERQVADAQALPRIGTEESP